MIKLVSDFLFGKWVEFDRVSIDATKFGHDIYDIVWYLNLRTYEIHEEVIHYSLCYVLKDTDCIVTDFLGRDIYREVFTTTRGDSNER